MAPPPPAGLPGASAPKAPTAFPGATAKVSEAGGYAAPPAPTAVPAASSSGPGRPSAPPPPGTLPGASVQRTPAPPAPGVLPGSSSGGYSSKTPAPPAPGALPGAAPSAPSSLPGTGPRTSFSAPPPPMFLPSAISGRAGPSDLGFSAPPAPSGLPGLPARPTTSAAPPKPSTIPSTTARPDAPSSLPGSIAVQKSSAEPVQKQEEQEEALEEHWKQYIEDDSEESEPDAFGDDSDEEVDTSPQVGSHADRHKNDLELLQKMQAKSVTGRSASTPKASNVDADKNVDRIAANSEDKEEQKQDASNKVDHDDDEDSVQGTTTQLTEATTPSADTGSTRKSLMSRLIGGLGRSSVKEEVDFSTSSMLKEKFGDINSEAYEAELKRLGRDGLRCTKVGTNGKPYDRKVLLDSRNMQVEIRGGRTGSVGMLLDELVDVRSGLASKDFQQFVSRFPKESSGVEIRSIVLQTPHRTFSFILPDRKQRDTLAMCIIYLLKSKERGVFADSVGGSTSSGKTSVGPKNGNGIVHYPNRSSYEGQFQSYLRHGKGVLTLSDKTRYESEWRHDERHGKGKEICPDGTTFEGSYVSGMRHGNGVMTWPEGSKYSGNFERGRANGPGELLRTDGSVYRGQFCEDCMSGEGRMLWRDGVEYVGQFVSNKREGFGKMTWTSGRWKYYEGHWKDGMQHDAGTLTDHNGQEFRGVFRLGKLDHWLED